MKAELVEMDEHETETSKTYAIINQMASAECDVQIRSAHAFPRSLHKVKQEVNTLVTESQAVAESCFYTMPRGGKPIIGPSVRFAEILASCWGNLRYGSMPLENGNGYVTSRGFCWDIQKNVAVSFDVKRRAVDRNGKPYNADMMLVTSNAASSIAMRNAILRVIPPAIWMPQYDLARQCAVGDVKTIAETRFRAIEAITKLGVPTDRIFAAVDAKGEADIDSERVLMLRTLYRSVKDGEMHVDTAFPDPKADPPQSNRDAILGRANAIADSLPDDRRPAETRRRTRKTEVPPTAPDFSPQEPTPAREPGEDRDDVHPEVAAIYDLNVACGFSENDMANVQAVLGIGGDWTEAGEDGLAAIKAHVGKLAAIAGSPRWKCAVAEERETICQTAAADANIKRLSMLTPGQVSGLVSNLTTRK